MMNKIIMFALGAAAGSLVTWKIVENKYKKIADEEIKSVKELYNKKLNALDCENNLQKVEAYDKPVEQPEFKVYVEKEENEIFSEEDKEEYNKLIEDEGYIIETPEEKEFIKPYVISPEEFGEFGNTERSLIYYSDFVLADEDDEIIVDPESIIGDALEHMGEYEDDCVHVRNENIECDFEILKSEKTFSEVYKGDE